MTTRLDQVLALLPELTDKERLSVSSALSFLAKPQDKADPVSTLIFSTLTEVVEAHQSMTGLSTYYRGLFDKHLPAFKALLVRFKQGGGRGAAQVMRLLWRMLADDLKRRQIPVSLGSMILNMGRVAEAFESAFPGYLDSGLADLVMRRRL